jgi:hypothetical protein
MADTAEISMATAKKRGPGRPFLPGRSGNPGGRPKRDPEADAILRGAVPSAVTKLIDLLASKNEKIALAAVNAVLDRAWGRPETSGRLELLSDKREMEQQSITIKFISPNKELQELPEMDGNWFDCSENAMG